MVGDVNYINRTYENRGGRPFIDDIESNEF